MNFSRQTLRNIVRKFDDFWWKIRDNNGRISTNFVCITFAQYCSSHENRNLNVFAYCMDVGEFTVDYGIEDANLIHFNEMPHKINKKAFILKVKKMQDGSSLFKGRFDFNLFKLIQDNFSNNYTIALEIYFERFPFTEKEFNSVRISFEKIYMYINHNATPIPIVNIISQY